MNAKSILILVFGITFFLFSCSRDSDLTPEETEIIPHDCSLSQFYVDQIEYYKNQIPDLVETFDTLHLEWRRNLTLDSDAFKQSNSIAYPALLNFCLQHGKAILPLVIERIDIKPDGFSICLLKDLTYVGDPWPGFWNYMDSYSNITEPTTNRCKMVIFQEKLLENEEDNIQKSIIQYLSETGNEVSDTNTVTVSSQEILINLNSENSETAAVKIYSIAGFIEYEANYTVLNDRQAVVIDASNFRKGVCIVQITIGGKTTSQKISI